MSRTDLAHVDLGAPLARYQQMWEDICRCNVRPRLMGAISLGDMTDTDVEGVRRFTDPGERGWPCLLDFGPEKQIRAMFDTTTTPASFYAGIIQIHRLPVLSNLPRLMNATAPPMLTTHLGDGHCWFLLPRGRPVNFGLLMMVMLGHKRGDAIVT